MLERYDTLIGYDQTVSTSINVVTSKNLINFGPASHVESSNLRNNDKGKGRIANRSPNFFGMKGCSEQNSQIPVRRVQFHIPIPTRHLCGKVGHIRPHYNHLSHRPFVKEISQVYEVGIHNNTLYHIISFMKDITFRLDKFEGNQSPTLSMCWGYMASSHYVSVYFVF